MALIVTFGRTSSAGSYIPLENLMSARTESIAVGGSTELGTLFASGSENMVTVTAGEDCYFAGGNNSVPDPTGEKRRFLGAGQQAQFAVTSGTQIGVIAA